MHVGHGLLPKSASGKLTCTCMCANSNRELLSHGISKNVAFLIISTSFVFLPLPLSFIADKGGLELAEMLKRNMCLKKLLLSSNLLGMMRLKQTITFHR